MTLVLRANELANEARHSHEDASILAAQAGFLRSSILDQASILVRLRRSIQATYDWGKKDFKRLVKGMDDVGGEVEDTMDLLRQTEVQPNLRVEGEDRKSLLDYVEESSVDGMKEALKKSIQELQGIQQSFDGDLLRFDTDIRSLKKIISESHLPLQSPDSEPEISSTSLLYEMFDHSSSMAQLLASLTKHFDMCVTALRTTEGAAALARAKAAETSSTVDPVSLSGMIASQEGGDGSNSVKDPSQLSTSLEPKTAADHAEMLKVVVQDALEVEDVVQEIQDLLLTIESQHATIQTRHHETETFYQAMLEAYALLADVADHLVNYLLAEEDFRTRWDIEKEIIFAKLAEMKEMRNFYEGYASAYEALMLEVERRKGVEEKVQSIWRKAQESVDKLLEQDTSSREAFRMDVGEYLPTDLWMGVKAQGKRWQVVPVEVDEEGQPVKGDTPP